MEEGSGEGKGIFLVSQALQEAAVGPLDGPMGSRHPLKPVEMLEDGLPESGIARTDLQGPQESEPQLPPQELALPGMGGADESFGSFPLTLVEPRQER